jgi:DNA-binding NtrC family response regulator
MHLLIVDDESNVLSALQRALRLHFGARLQVTVNTDAHAALRLAHGADFDLVVSDLRMPAMDGIRFLEQVATLQPHAVRMILTGSADFETAQRAINEVGLFRYLTKPWGDAELAAHIEAAMTHAEDSAQQRLQAEAWQLEREPVLTAEEHERRRLEALEPGITHVEWGPGGEVLMPALDAE